MFRNKLRFINSPKKVAVAGLRQYAGHCRRATETKAKKKKKKDHDLKRY